MSRVITIAAAQMGPVQRDDTRAEVVERMLSLLHDARALGAELVVYPELALTTFFPRWYFEDERELDEWFETEMPSVDTKPLFDEAARLGVGFCLGFAELTPEGRRYNTQVLVEETVARSAATARCTFPVTTSTSLGGSSSISRSATSKSAPTASRCGGRLEASSAWPSATTDAGPRPTGCSGCRAPS